MTHYYTRTFVGMGIVFGVLAAAAVLSNSAADNAGRRYSNLLEQDKVEKQTCEALRQKLERLQVAMQPVHDFAAAWKSAAKLPEKDAAERVRSDIEAIAQRQLGLVTDDAITPQPEKFLFQGLPLRVQRVTLRASGKDLVALLTWLGRVEEKYPAALVEQCEFSSNVGGNTGLTLRLVQPLLENGPHHLIVPMAVPESALAPEAIAGLGWPQYMPSIVKGSIAIGFQRNPLQPAVAADSRPIPIARDDTDDITPRIEKALDGHLRSVIRGATPIIVVDGRVFRTGDELVCGSARERPIPEAKTKLKEIAGDRLLFHVAGGTADRPVQCDISYALPEFLKAR